jgi:glycine/D-amino acid oxidase-like deaminating enzyme
MNSSAPIDMPDPGSARSFWLQEALAHDPGAACPPLEAALSADVCIVGGGFAGMWTAVELTERDPSLRVVLVEQDICGGGASGRNGGFISPSWWDLEGLCKLFGRDEGVRYATVVADSVSQIGGWLERHDVDAWFHHDGVLGARAGSWQDGVGATDAAAFCGEMGLGDRMRPLTAPAARAIADSPRFVGGAFLKDSATVQPARMARGLRRVLLERGVHIFERTRVTDIHHEMPAVVVTEHGRVRAPQVVLTTGAWAAACPGFRRSFGVIVDYMVATEPIPDRLEEIGWVSDAGIADGRDLLYYLRKTDDGRIAIGGGASGVAFGGRFGRSVTHDRRVAEVAARGLLWLFPQLEGVRFTHAWGGPIDQTAAFVPFYRTLEPGNVHAGLGFSGHGLSQTFVGSKILASKVLGVENDWTSLGVNRGEFAKAPPEPVRWPLVKMATSALRAGDAREEEGRARGAFLDLIGTAPIRFREHLGG